MTRSIWSKLIFASKLACENSEQKITKNNQTNHYSLNVDVSAIKIHRNIMHQLNSQVVSELAGLNRWVVKSWRWWRPPVLAADGQNGSRIWRRRLAISQLTSHACTRKSKRSWDCEDQLELWSMFSRSKQVNLIFYGTGYAARPEETTGEYGGLHRDGSMPWRKTREHSTSPCNQRVK